MTLAKTLVYTKVVFRVAKTIVLTLLSLLVFTFLAGNIFAHEGEVDPYEDVEEAALAPDSPFYFLRSWQEAVERFVANFQSDEAQVNLELTFAQRRIAEMKRLARLGEDGELMERLSTRWQENIDQARERVEQLGERKEEVEELILEQIDRQRTVMERMLDQVPHEAKDAINRAIENYQTHRERLLDNFTGDRLERIKDNLRDRLDSTIERFELRRERFRDQLENGADETTTE